MGRVRWALLVVAIIVASSIAPRAGVLDPLSYTLHVVHKKASGELVTTDIPGVLAVPATVNADGDASTGVAGADLVAHLGIDAGRATLRVVKLPNTPASFPVLVEAIIGDPRGALPVPLLGTPDPTLRVAFGYDTLDATAPGVFEVAVSVAGPTRITSFSMDMRALLPGPSLAVIGEAFTQGSGGERIDPVRGRISFTPVPITAHFGVISSEDVGGVGGAGQSSIDLASNTPTRADISIEDVQGAHRTVVGAVIDKLPSTLVLTQTDIEGTGRQTFSYRASDRVATVELRMTVTNAATTVQDTLLQIDDMPMTATLEQNGEHTMFSTDSQIGAVTGGFSTGGPPLLLPGEPAYLYRYQVGAVESVAFRLRGLSSADVTAGDPFRFEVTMQPGPFLIRVIEGAAILNAQIYDLPATVTLSGSRGGGTIEYEGSAGITRMFIDIQDPAGIGGTRAKVAHVVLEGVPQSLTIVYASSGGTVSLDANGATLGLIEVQLTTGPNDRIPAGFDGILLNDLADRYVVFARITQLRRVVVRTTPLPDLTLDSTGGQIFLVETNRLAGAKVEYIRARLDRLVPDIRVTVTDTSVGQTISYTASSATNSLTIDTNTGDRASLHIDIGNPLPASLSVCQASNGTCSSHGSANAGSIRVLASEHTTVNFFDCQRPLTPTCTSAPTKFLYVSNLRIRFLEQDAAIEGAINGERGYIYVDTDNHNLSGYLLTINGGNGGFEVNLPPGFRAENRKVSWTFFGLFKNRSGTVVCPGGTSLRVRVLGFWLGVTSFLC